VAGRRFIWFFLSFNDENFVTWGEHLRYNLNFFWSNQRKVNVGQLLKCVVVELNLNSTVIIRDLLELECVVVALGLICIFNVVNKNSVWLTHEDVVKLLLLRPQNKPRYDKPANLQLLHIVGK
jgi:hypothetical protein